MTGSIQEAEEEIPSCEERKRKKKWKVIARITQESLCEAF